MQYDQYKLAITKLALTVLEVTRKTSESMHSKLLALVIFCVTVIRCDNDVKCGDSYDCAEKELVGYIEELDNKESVPVIGNLVTLERIGDVQRSKTEDVIERSLRFLANHQLKVKMPARSSRSLIDGK